MKPLLGMLSIGLISLCGCSGVETRWQDATAKNTVGSYASFLGRYPTGPHSPEAHKRLDQLRAEALERSDWQDAQRKDSIPAYADFEQKHPASLHHDEVLKATSPKILPTIQDLAGHIEKWTDVDRSLSDGILRLSPTNPYVLLLRGVDEARNGRFDSAREALTKAKAGTRDETVSDIVWSCTVSRTGDAYGLEVVRPVWEGPEADEQRRRTNQLEREAARVSGGLLIVPKGVCLPQLLIFDTSEGGRSPRRTLKYWIDYDLGELAKVAN